MQCGIEVLVRDWCIGWDHAINMIYSGNISCRLQLVEISSFYVLSVLLVVKCAGICHTGRHNKVCDSIVA